MNRLCHLVLPTIVLLCLTATALAQPTQVVVPMEDFPPYKIPWGGQFSGSDADIARALLSEAGLKPRFIKVPWRRGLAMMREGEADLLTGVIRTRERETYMIFLEPPYKVRSDKALYIRKDSPDITSYKDLRGLTIGVLRGARFFEPFDSDETLSKEQVNSDELNFRKLDQHRVDAVLVTEKTGDYLVKELSMESRVRKATFKYEACIPVYFTVSRMSPLAARADELSRLVRRLKKNGVLDRIMAVEHSPGR